MELLWKVENPNENGSGLRATRVKAAPLPLVSLETFDKE
jgi:hypothetical protein